MPAPDPPGLSVVIINWNTRERLRACLCSIAEHLGDASHEVIVVDNASEDGSAEMVGQEFSNVRLVANRENVGFGRANNQAMREARGSWFLLLNSDTVLVDDSVALLFGRLDQEQADARGDGARIGVAHCRLQFPDGRLQYTAYRFPSLWRALFEGLGLYKLSSPGRAADVLLGGYWDHAEERDVDWVAGAFMMVQREVFEVTAGFDERFFMYGEDLDWCYRIRDQGWRVRYYPTTTIIHYDHQSAELKWGDERIAICLRTEHDILVERKGRDQAAAILLIRLAGQALRLAYYSVRARLPGPKASDYDSWRRYAAISSRALVALALGRR